MNTDKEIEENWESIWKPILQRSDGSIDIEQLKKELYDFSEMIDRMSTLTCKLTGDKLSYPDYPVETILNTAYEVYENNQGCPVCGSERYGDGE